MEHDANEDKNLGSIEEPVVNLNKGKTMLTRMLAEKSETNTALRFLESLPLVVLNRLMHFCSRATLRNLRLTCKLVSHEASRRFFSLTYLGCTEDQALAFDQLYERPEIKKWMRRVCLKTTEGEKERFDEDPDELSEKTKATFLNLKSLDNLSGLELIFSIHCAVDRGDMWYWGDPTSSFEYRSGVLGLVADLYESRNSKNNIRDLCIYGLQNANSKSVTDRIGFRNLLAGLKSLRLHIVSEKHDPAPECEISMPELPKFISEMPSTWLTSTSLTSLVLHFDHFVGFYPCLDWRETNFPSLRTLALRRHSFCQQWQLDWLYGLRNTLEELYLDDCNILYEWQTTSPVNDDGLPILIDEKENGGAGELTDYKGSFLARWHQFFDGISTDLINLKDFRFGWGSDFVPTSFYQFMLLKRNFHAHDYRAPYAIFFESYGQGETRYSTQDDEYDEEFSKISPEILEKDAEAYDSLLAKIGLPASNKGFDKELRSWESIPSAEEE